MPNKILVTYASRTGSTTGVAQAIGTALTQGGAQVEVRPMSEVQDLTPYDAVVAGSAIHNQAWLPEALQFIQAHQAELAQKPFADCQGLFQLLYRLLQLALRFENPGQHSQARDGVSGFLCIVP